MEKREIPQKAHIQSTIDTPDVFSLLQNDNNLTLIATQPHMYLFIEVYNDLTHCKVC